jgi:hypothetical protein
MTLTSLDLVAGAYPLDCLQVTELASDGDFRSTEVTALRDESDFVITNPPFSLFREFLAWIREGGQQFSLISNKSAATYKETFPLIMNNELWVGARPWSGGMWFVVPDNATDYDKAENGKRLKNVPASWYTNIDHGRRHEELRYMTMAKNQEFNIRLLNKRAYVRYDNYDAIEVPVSNAIPCDYKGVMGVPISYLDKHCPEVFEIVGMSANGLVPEAMKLAHFKRHNEPFIDGKKTYQRIFIRAIN